jgi:hypothetical protein
LARWAKGFERTPYCPTIQSERPSPKSTETSRCSNKAAELVTRAWFESFISRKACKNAHTDIGTKIMSLCPLLHSEHRENRKVHRGCIVAPRIDHSNVLHDAGHFLKKTKWNVSDRCDLKSHGSSDRSHLAQSDLLRRVNSVLHYAQSDLFGRFQSVSKKCKKGQSNLGFHPFSDVHKSFLANVSSVNTYRMTAEIVFNLERSAVSGWANAKWGT